VDRLQGSSPKTPVMEILVQGPQKDAVIKALEKRGVNKTWVEVLDKTKGKKK
jgi:translation initiation factor 2D